MNISSDLNLRVIKKLDFEAVNFIFHALHDAFHPNGLEEEDTNPNFIALWTLSLSCCGWTDDEYWEELDNRPCTCNNCDDPIEDITKEILPENKSN